LALTAAGVDVDELLAPAAEPPATSRPAGSRFPALSDAQKLRAPDGGPQRVEWAALLGDWSADSAGRITGRTDHEAYLCRVKPHADDLRLTATVRAVEGGEVTVWICGSPENAEHDGYTLAVSSGGAKLQRKGQDVARAWETTIRPGRDYVLSFERLGATLRGFLDEAGKPFVEWADSEPLRGPGHRTLGFYVWQGAVAVSKIKVEDLPPQPFTPPKPAPERPTVIGGIDYSKLSLKANGHTHDSFSLTIEAAARLLGKRPEYETIYALSTNAFAPCVNPCEPSIHWRHTDKGRGLCLDIVAGRLGLALRALPCPGESSVPPEPKDKAARDVWLREHWRKPMIQPIRAALSAGAVVITREGWNSHPPSGGLNPWCWWGLILEACDDGEILGASLNGRRDNPMWYVDGAWAVSPGTPTLTPHRADLLMLQRAVHRIRGDADPFLPTERMVFGLKAMDLWIEQMKQVPFCGDCGKGRSAACATCCAQPTYMGAETAMNYLRKRKGSFAAQARLHVEAAATHYQKILGLLRPALTGEGGEQYEQIIDNAAKQKAHAKVLQQVKAELAAAANEMEKALAAEGVDVAASTPGTAAGTATSRQVMLDDFVKVFKQMQAEVTSYNHARTDLIMRLIFMRAAGVKDADYDSLVALSGYGTSFAYHPRNYKVMYYPPDGSSATDARIAAASGFGWEWIRDCKDPDKAWGIVTESVAAGKPVEGRWYDDVVFAGYQDAPDRAGRKVYVMGGWDEPGWWTWERFEKWARQFGALGRHTKTVRKAPGRQTAVGLMKSIVKCADNDGRAEEKWMGPGKFGFDGMEAYAADVADVSKKPEYFYDGWLGCHSINRQMSARKCAAAYLREAATEFPEKVADRILAAATEYEAARAAWGEWESHLGQAGGRTKIGELKEVWSLKKNREAGAAAIRKALDRERAAVAEIEKALALTQ